MIVGSILATGITTLLMTLTIKGVSDFGTQVQEQNKTISSSSDRLAAVGGDIMVYSSYLPVEHKGDVFENGEHKIIIFVTSAILLLVVTIGFCLFCWGCCCFGGCRKYNTKKQEDFNSEDFLHITPRSMTLCMNMKPCTMEIYILSSFMHKKVRSMTQSINMKPLNMNMKYNKLYCQFQHNFKTNNNTEFFNKQTGN